MTEHVELDANTTFGLIHKILKKMNKLISGERQDSGVKRPIEDVGDCGTQKSKEWSQPISRVLSWTIIHLGAASPRPSSDLPESSARHAQRIPIWSCSRWGLPCRRVLPPTRCALTAPFHPYRQCRRSALCCTFRRLTPPRRYLAPCLEEPGLSSPAFAAAIAWLTPPASVLA